MNSLLSLARSRLIGCLMIAMINVGAETSVYAQLIPDRTLVDENSIVTPQGIRDLIEGGAIRGSNLFHSFEQFNVGDNQQVYFANPSGVVNILTRVTGNNVSNIWGTLGVDGAANLFLINPNGIIFGASARLDISGSFVATTSDGIKLGENGLFSAKEPDKSTLLAIQPGALFTNAQRSYQAEIRNQGSLAVGTGQRLTLQGDIVTSTGNLNAPGGIVQVLGTQVNLLENASINVSSPTGGGTVLLGNGKQVDMGSGVRINADSLNNGLGGTVVIKSDETTRFEGAITARGGENAGNGGFVEVSGGNLQFSGTVDTSAPVGEVGKLLLDPKNILIQAGSPISGLAISQALFLNDVILQADNDITVDDDITGVGANNLTLLAGRSLTIAPNRSILLNGGSFTAKFNDENALIPSDRDPGIAQFIMSPASRILTNGGNVTVVSGTFGQTSQISTANAGIITSNQAGNSGNITLFALGDITTGLLDTRTETGNGGDINISSAGGAIVTTNSVLADSLFQAGDILLTAASNLTINGNITTNGTTPGKLTLTSSGSLTIKESDVTNINIGSGTPNDITLTTGSLILENAAVYPATIGEGQAGNVLIDSANEVILRNSTITNIAFSGSGSSGDITLNTGRLTIIKEPGAIGRFSPFRFGIGTFGTQNSSGNTGNVTINTLDSIEIIGDRPGAFNPIPQQLSTTLLQADTGLTTSALGSGNSGNLTVNTGRLVVRDRAGITTFPTLGEGGDLKVSAREIFLQGESGIGTSTLGGDAGTLRVNADRVTVTDGAVLGATTFGTLSRGNAGTFNLSVGSLSVRNGSLVGSSTLSLGNGGTTTIEASDFIEVTGVSADGSVRSGITTNSYLPESGNAGALSLTSDRLILRDGGEVATATVGQGQGGALTINARTLQLNNGRINASTLGSGNGGDISIRASESVDITGTGFNILQQQIVTPALEATLRPDNFNQGIVTITAGSGNAGNVSIETPNFTARDGGLIATTTLAGGAGGNIAIDTSNTLALDDSLLSTGTFTNAPSGNVTLNARQLIAKGGAQVLTTTFGSGKAGDLTANVSDSIDLIDPNNSGSLLATGLFATSAQNTSGDGGDININIPNGELNVRDGAAVSVSTQGTGNAGDVNIDARSIFLDRGNILATTASGNGGNINLKVKDVLLMRNRSLISTTAGTAQQPGDGGNINIDAGFVVAVPTENSDIVANAFRGDGGRIAIATNEILGLEFRNQLTPLSDITAFTASPQLGFRQGEFQLTRFIPGVVDKLSKLPEQNFTDPSDQIVAGCPADRGNTFTVTGRGGIPDNPNQYLRGRAVWQDTRNLPPGNHPTPPTINNQQSTTDNQHLVEAQGWIVDANGTVTLTAEPYTGKQPNFWTSSQSCQ